MNITVDRSLGPKYDYDSNGYRTLKAGTLSLTYIINELRLNFRINPNYKLRYSLLFPLRRDFICKLKLKLGLAFKIVTTFASHFAATLL